MPGLNLEGIRIIDISPSISDNMAVFPGDVQYQREVSMDMQLGDHLTLSSITTTLHLGAHADAPNHYAVNGSGIHSRNLNLYMGPCTVIDFDCSRGMQINLEELPEELPTPRILFKTGSFPDPNIWTDEFSFFSDEFVTKFAHRGGVLLGIDTPSIDAADSKDLPAHSAVSQNDLAVLEGLVLGHVEPGNYNLIALPLRLVGADASPVRAVLLPYQL